MKIGIDLTWQTDKPAGVETMVGEVLMELVSRKEVQLMVFVLRGSTRVYKGISVREVRSGWLRHVDLYLMIRKESLDVLWQVGGWLPLFFPHKLKTIQTVHDLISADHPAWFPQTGFSARWSWYMRVGRSLRRATVIHAISHWTEKQIMRLFPDTRGKIIAAYQGVSAPDQIRTEQIPKYIQTPFIVILGTIEPRKNIPLACEAFLLFAQEHPDPHLVFVGKRGWKAEESLMAIETLQKALPGRVHVEFYVTHAEKWALLSGASAVLMVSHAEGFGRPLVEAMSVGTPVIASANSAMQEVVEDAGILVPPDDVQKTARAMWRALYHPTLSDRLIELGSERAKRFSTKQMVDCVLETINKTTS